MCTIERYLIKFTKFLLFWNQTLFRLAYTSKKKNWLQTKEILKIHSYCTLKLKRNGNPLTRACVRVYSSPEATLAAILSCVWHAPPRTTQVVVRRAAKFCSENTLSNWSQTPSDCHLYECISDKNSLLAYL